MTTLLWIYLIGVGCTIILLYILVILNNYINNLIFKTNANIFKIYLKDIDYLGFFILGSWIGFGALLPELLAMYSEIGDLKNKKDDR